MKTIILLILFVSITVIVNAQVRLNSGVGANISTSSAFMDASSSTSWNGSTNIGKGFVFPRVSLITFASFANAGVAGVVNNYPSRFDGMIVYNTATGNAGIGNTPVTPGFYYYKNKTTTLNGGTWVRMLDTPSAGDVTYYGVLATNAPSSTDITGLTNKSLSSGIYTGSFDLTLSSDGYFTLALPASWRNPLLKIDGSDTFDVMKPVQSMVINDVNYVIWQSDVTLPSGKQVSIN